MIGIASAEEVEFEARVQIVIVGAGACGLTAALAAADAGGEVLVLERDESPFGSTSMSSGFIPAPATRWQHAKGIDDDPGLFLEDIQRKSHDRSDPTVAAEVVEAIGPALEWLEDEHGIPFELLDGFLYPGHSRLRMHAVPEHTGEALLTRLLQAVMEAGVPVMTGARVTTLFADEDGMIAGVEVTRPDGSQEMIGCGSLILACNGYGGNPDMVAEHIPTMAGAEYHGHAGNTGDAVIWGEALGAEIRDLTGCQGHGSLAMPHRILITWALMMEGGIQVNRTGGRFANEHQGYSEQAVDVLKQPGGIAFDIYDARLHTLGLEFPDYRDAVHAGAVRQCNDLETLAEFTGAPQQNLEAAMSETYEDEVDRFGRDLGKTPPLQAPFFAVRVTGALFHTQGGLAVDGEARVLREDGSSFLNLFAAGGAAVGVSGPEISGYLSGNGLLTAVALGRIAGEAAATVW
ncbi:FAD-dependent oxidoreductase [Nisaea acidiphila]|uniref:FAD-dependent oxidoreductase n=1 Tax=Nisaea acidiphila TaxID=1862145 RepID=A0A9J7APG0_9PROT|nr:FAD-dependent oxidoreductase [Nisaea acidiphila]UUX49046.1 FAD-dependent oxidoreductase [Nisaea acidiphila]